MPGVKIVTEELEKEITLLKDVKANFVSLVRHGANRMPFRIVKTEKKGGDEETMRYAIQSILIPKGKTLEELSMEKGLEYLSEANVENKQEFTDYDKYHQVSLEKFDSESMRLIKVGSGYAIIGELPKDVGGAILLGKEDVEKLADIPVSPMNSIIGDPDVAAQQAMAARFRDVFDNELYAMMDIIYGSLKQSSTATGQRKKTIVSAVDAFKQFITIALDAIGEQAAKIDKLDLEGGNEDMFKTKEEFTEAVTTIVTAAFDARDAKRKEEADAAAKAAADKAAADKAAAEADTKKTDSDKSTDVDQFKAIADSVKALAEKVEKMGDQLASTPAEDDQDDADTKKTDEPTEKPVEMVKDTAYDKSKPGDKKAVIDKGVFGGLLTKKVA